MAWLAGFIDSAPALLATAGQEANTAGMLFNSLVTSTTAEHLQQQQLQQQQNLQAGYFQNLNAQNTQQQASYQNLQNTKFDSISQLQASGQNFQSQQTQTMINAQRTQGYINSGMNFGSNLLSAGVNYLASSALMNQQASLQRQNFDYMTGKASDALTSQGLPSWLAYGNSSAASAFPRTSQAVNGNNFFNSSLPGNVSSIPWMDSQSQVSLGVGNIPMSS